MTAITVLARLALAAASGLGLLVCAGAIEAGEEGGWQVDRLLAEVVVQSDGAVIVIETIEVDFGAEGGVFERAIPVERRADATHNRVYDVTLVAVTDGSGGALPFEQERAGPHVRLRVGQPGRVMTGEQAFRLSYVVRDALDAQPEHDELHWVVTGGGWRAPVQEVGVSVRLQEGPITAVSCYYGEFGLGRACDSSVVQGGAGAIAASGRELAPGEELTVAVAFPKGLVPPPEARLVERPASGVRLLRSYFEPSPLYGGAALLMLGLTLALFWTNWWRNGRDRAYTALYYRADGDAEVRPLLDHEKVTVERAPPEDLRPAQMGVLLDEGADAHDVAATIVDLAVRGFVAIEEKDRTWQFGSTDWRLVKRREPRALRPFERTIVNAIFAGGATTAELSAMKSGLGAAAREAQRQLHEDAMRNRWFHRDPAVRGDRLRFAGLAIAILGVGAVYVLGRLSGAGLVGAPVMLLGVMLTFPSSWMPRRTPRGSDMLRRGVGVPALHRPGGRVEAAADGGAGQRVRRVSAVRDGLWLRGRVGAGVQRHRHGGGDALLVCGLAVVLGDGLRGADRAVRGRGACGRERLALGFSVQLRQLTH